MPHTLDAFLVAALRSDKAPTWYPQAVSIPESRKYATLNPVCGFHQITNPQGSTSN